MDRDSQMMAPSLRRAKGLVSILARILRALAGPTSKMPKHIGVSHAVGNFLMGDFFGDVKCRHGHETRLFNIGRGHFIACDDCRTYMFVGSNLMSNWRQENEDIWRANSDSLEGYEWLD